MRLWGGAILLVCGVAAAQPARNRAERQKDRREIATDNRERRDDIRDARRLQMLLAAFDQARAAANNAQLGQVDQQLLALLDAEQRESAGELRRDNAEIRRDNREIGSDKREVRRDAPGTAQKADDRRDLRDDRRDRRDDVRDRNVEAAGMARRAAIGNEYRALVGKYDPPAVGKKRALIVELSQMASVEIRQDNRELREDRRELREDRRETREDRRQR